MRVLLATDGSRSADRARDLVAHLPWPDGTHVRIVTSIEPRAELVGSPWIVPAGADLDELEHRLERHAQDALEDAERTIVAPGRVVDSLRFRGRAASAILAEARDWPADLVVLGSRGHGALATMVLGSVSAEIVDRAPCPVLVVRDAEATETILAADGTDGALLAERAIGSWPVLRALPCSVVTIADTRVPFPAGLPVGLYDEAAGSWATGAESAIADCRAVAESVAERLRIAGVAAVAHVRDGDPARELVDFAAERPHALVVMGTHGRRGLARLILGSVARNVLTHAHGSVLVVRDTVEVHADAAESVAAGAAVGVGAAGR